MRTVKEWFKFIASVHFVKEVAHVFLFIVSSVFSVNLFIHLSSVPVFQVVWAVVAVVFEFLKIYAFMYFKFRMKYFDKASLVRAVMSFLAVVMSFSIYFGTATLSGVATLGFAKVSITQQSFVANRSNSNSSIYESEIGIIDEELELIDKTLSTSIKEKEKMAGSEAMYYTGQNKMSAEMDSLFNRKKELLDRRRELAEKLSGSVGETKVVSSDIFTLIGDTPYINMSGDRVMFYLFIMLVILLELTLCMTSGELNEDENKIDMIRKRNLSKYVVALFDTSGNRLNSDKKIATATGLDIKDCKKFRKFLTSKTFGGTPLLRYGRGYSNSDFTKEEILSIINS